MSRPQENAPTKVRSHVLTVRPIKKKAFGKGDNRRLRRYQLRATRPDVEVYVDKMLSRFPKSELRYLEQPSIGNYYPDFLVHYGWQARILIEIDGGYHTTIRQHLIDANKAEFFNKMGYVVVHMSPDYAAELTVESLRNLLRDVARDCQNRWLSASDIETPEDPQEQFKRFAL